MAPLLWTASAGFAALAVVAGLGARRWRRRRDPDAVGWVDWPTVQMFALIALAVTVRLAMQG